MATLLDTSSAQPISKNDLTYIAVNRALDALGAQSYELGCLHRGDPRDYMDMRQDLTKEEVLAAIPGLRAEQRSPDTHIYVRPYGNTNLTLVDDLTGAAVGRMRKDGLQPALVVQTSKGNYQAWVKHAAPLDPDMQRHVSRELARRYDGDIKATGDRRFGRLAGFRNMKEKYKYVVPVPAYDEWRARNFYRNLEAQWVGRDHNIYTDERLHEIHAKLQTRTYYPFVTITDSSGRVAEQSPELIAAAVAEIGAERKAQARMREYFASAPERARHAKTITQFHNDPRYDGDLSRADLAYAVHAAGRGMSDTAIAEQIAARDLSKKGHTLQRQQEYIHRTIQKARQQLSMQMAHGMSL
jgi:hypothetical protein